MNKERKKTKKGDLMDGNNCQKGKIRD